MRAALRAALGVAILAAVTACATGAAEVSDPRPTTGAPDCKAVIAAGEADLQAKAEWDAASAAADVKFGEYMHGGDYAASRTAKEEAQRLADVFVAASLKFVSAKHSANCPGVVAAHDAVARGIDSVTHKTAGADAELAAAQAEWARLLQGN